MSGQVKLSLPSGGSKTLSAPDSASDETITLPAGTKTLATVENFTSTGIDDNATSTAITIDASENVGIGTTTPSSKLDVNGDTSTDGLLITNPLSGSYYNAKVEFRRDGTSGGAKIETARHAAGGVGLAFNVTSSNTAEVNGTYTTAMTINNSGNIGWGSYSKTGGGVGGEISSGTHIFETSTNTTSSYARIRFYNPNGQVGDIRTINSSTQYTTSSDYRLKENVVPMTGSIDRLKQLKPSRFNFIADADTTVDGFLAHEAGEVVPECATGEKDAMTTEEYEVTPAVKDEEGNVVTEAVMGEREVPDYQGIDQSKLVPLLVASLQEAVAKIEALETRVTQLENNV